MSVKLNDHLLPTPQPGGNKPLQTVPPNAVPSVVVPVTRKRPTDESIADSTGDSSDCDDDGGEDGDCEIDLN
jgi:hypothetical protein